MRRDRRDFTETSLSFLDVICCGFGAIILLLMITKVGDPLATEVDAKPIDGSIRALEQQLFRVKGEGRILNRELNARIRQVEEQQLLLAKIQAELSQFQAKAAAMVKEKSGTTVKGQYALARQTLTEEMERLLAQRQRKSSDAVGGIPVDSEYIIFVIDSSGSMFQNAWPLVIQKLEETLDVYPQVKGIQIMNDDGRYMFNQYATRWIPDNPTLRRAIVNRLRTWNPQSDSNPADGIEKAVAAFYADDKKISIYYFGDDFSGGSITRVLETVDRINKKNKSGERRVRVHAVGFPVIFSAPSMMQDSGHRFANLMRQMANRNGGTFVGLPSFQ